MMVENAARFRISIHFLKFLCCHKTLKIEQRKCLFLLRKEVIQPHLPIRLPCYDFTPVIGFTFDSFLPYGLDHWLRAPSTSMV